MVADETLDARHHLRDFIQSSAKIKNWIIYKILEGDDIDARGHSFAQAVKIAMVRSEMKPHMSMPDIWI